MNNLEIKKSPVELNLANYAMQGETVINQVRKLK